RHRRQVLPGGHQHYPPTVARVVVLSGELAYQQQRGAHVLVEEGVDLGGREISESAVAAASVIDDQDVERSKRLSSRRYDLRGRPGVAEFCFEERPRKLSGRRFGASRLGAPMLICIVRSPAVDENGRSGVVQVTRDGVADSRATAGAGDESVTAG